MASKGTTLSSYNPSWREKIAWALSDMVAGDDGSKNRGLRNYVNDKVKGAVDVVPVVGDAVGMNDAKNDYDAGNYGSAAFNAATSAVGGVPGLGDVVAAGLKGAGGILAPVIGRNSPKWHQMFHGTNKAFEGVPDADLLHQGVHASKYPSIAAAYAGIDPTNTIPDDLSGGRVVPLMVDPGNVYKHLDDFSGKSSLFDRGTNSRHPLWGTPDGANTPVFAGVPDKNWSAMPHNAKKVYDGLVSGATLPEALKSGGYDSMQYPHSDLWRAYMDAAPELDDGAMMYLHKDQALPMLSAEGLSIYNSGNFVRGDTRKLSRLKHKSVRDAYEYWRKNYDE